VWGYWSTGPIRDSPDRGILISATMSLSEVALPGVESAAVARDFPLGGTDPSMPVDTEAKHPLW
jgi:hypothetical protein